MDSGVETFIDELIQEKGIPYIDVACYREQEEIFRYYSGEKVNGKELLYMYSCSKPLTVATAMRLWEEGRLGLDDPVENYIPSVKNVTVLTDKGVRRAPLRKMTIRHLMTMSAGFDYNYTPEAVEKILEETMGTANTRQLVEGYIATPLLFDPGEKFNYSLCHDVLAAVIEVASRMRFSEYLRKTIFDPLGMKHSTFDNIPKGDMHPVYMCKDGKIQKTTGFQPTTPYYESGGSGLISTVEDYGRFAAALASGGVGADGYRLLRKETIDLIRTGQTESLNLKNSFTCVQGGDYSYGLGVRVRIRDTGWGLNRGEFGWDGAAGSYLMVDPENGISVVIGMHVQYWPRCFTGEHLNIVKKLYQEVLF